MLLIILVLTSAISAFADTKNEEDKSLTAAEVENIMGIPVYISTLADATDETAKEKCQQAIANDVELQMKVCQTYVTPSCKKLNKVSLGESHFNGRIGKLLYFRL